MTVDIIQLLCSVLIVGGLLALLCKRLGLSTIPGFILAGVVLSPQWSHSLWRFPADSPQVRTLSHVGVLLLMFTVGLHFGVRRIRAVGAPPFFIGVAECLTMGGAALLIARSFGFAPAASVYIGALFAFASTTVVFKAMDDLRLHRERLAGSVTGILIVEDILAIVAIVGLASFARPTGDATLPGLLFSLVAAVLGCWFIGSLVTPRLVAAARRYGGDELLVILCVGLCLGMGLLFESLHLSSALGAFVTGAILADTREIRLIRKNVAPLKDIFVALFFVTFGLRLRPDAFLENWKLILVFGIAVVVVKTSATLFYALVAGEKPRDALKMALLIVPIGEFSLVIADLGVQAGTLPDTFPATVIGVSVITITLGPLLVKSADPLLLAYQRTVPRRVRRALSGRLDAVSRLVTNGRVGDRTGGHEGEAEASAKRVQPGAVSRLLSHFHIGLLQTFRHTSTATLERLAPWDEFLVEIEIADNAEAEHKSIRQLALREHFGINVIAIEREGSVHVPPEPDFRLFSGDVLLLYGGRKSIRRASPLFDKPPADKVNATSRVKSLQDVTLRSLHVEGDHAFIGKSLHEIGLRPNFDSLLLAVERDGERIKNPPSDFVVEADDELHVVGPHDKLKTLISAARAGARRGPFGLGMRKQDRSERTP